MKLLLGIVLPIVLACVAPAHAVSKAKQCQQSCSGLVALCASATRAGGFGDLAKACKKSVAKRCKQEGVAACQAFCGDGARNGSEACDGTDFGGATCQSSGFGGGTLACASDCTLDTRGCTTASACGNGKKDPGEDCDGQDLGTTTCSGAGFTGGTPTCSASCRVDLSNCFTSLSVDLPIAIPTGNALWEDIDANSGGFFVGDVTLAIPYRYDAYDGFWTLAVDGAFYDPGSTADLTITSRGRTLSAPAVPLSGVQVTQSFTTFDAVDALRVLVSFQNTSGADVGLTAVIGGNLGSDLTTTIEGTSSGDLAFDQTDRWLVSSDANFPVDPLNPPDAVNTFVFYGPGMPLAPTSASLTSDVVSVTFELTIPAGSTRSLLFFSTVTGDPASATTQAVRFDTNTSVESAGLLDGLTPTVRSQIVNWGL